MGTAFSRMGGMLAKVLTQPRHTHSTGPFYSATRLLTCLRPGDVLLVEGSSRVSTAVKYLTQSTWSHAALYVGQHIEADSNHAHCFVEADIVEGVRSVGIEKFENLHTRICRPFGMTDADCTKVAEFAIHHIGDHYDLRNVLDLARYFFPTPPIPTRFRRRLLAFGSGDPTRAICSTLIALAFQSVRYPILPIVSSLSVDSPDCPGCIEEIYRLRHHSLFTPRDFDVSPYFQIIKPILESGFDFKSLHWEEK
ncbi:MAG: YiiX/YebB-like N1pC/P60 family cysteine hydrolase [Gallionella sp.]|nr:YiiX/YebB-like N1pC/P60 family cysteine hydrolase [Gallionella sp.]MDD4946869.1 YiiX/YebB-like N1pC/P60 family cysteine hydrolase [Gallionella sp.]